MSLVSSKPSTCGNERIFLLFDFNLVGGLLLHMTGSPSEELLLRDPQSVLDKESTYGERCPSGEKSPSSMSLEEGSQNPRESRSSRRDDGDAILSIPGELFVVICWCRGFVRKLGVLQFWREASSLQGVLECSDGVREVLECSREFGAVLECSDEFGAVLECSNEFGAVLEECSDKDDGILE